MFTDILQPVMAFNKHGESEQIYTTLEFIKANITMNNIFIYPK